MGASLVFWDFNSSRLTTVPTELFSDRVMLSSDGTRAISWGDGAIPRMLDLKSHVVLSDLGKKGGLVHPAPCWSSG